MGAAVWVHSVLISARVWIQWYAAATNTCRLCPEVCPGTSPSCESGVTHEPLPLSVSHDMCLFISMSKIFKVTSSKYPGPKIIIILVFWEKQHSLVFQLDSFIIICNIIHTFLINILNYSSCTSSCLLTSGIWMVTSSSVFQRSWQPLDSCSWCKKPLFCAFC